MDKSYFDISEEIQLAIENQKPIVALESALISHGLPYPENIYVAQSSINTIRENGSIPATIAIINGRIKVGLSNDDIKTLSENSNVEKISKHNLANSLNNNNHGTTTVASTIYLAANLGIKFFSTGGIGGVHLNVENTFDISSDLRELSKTPICVVCSGAKSILDLDKTFERLETLGISRIGFQTDYMPGFWYYQTNKKVDHNYTTINELTNYLKIRENLKLDGSVLLFNAIPKDKAIDKKLVQEWINISIKKAKKNLIEGKELTPYLIREINNLSKNKTLEANKELIICNATLAAKVAANYKKIS